MRQCARYAGFWTYLEFTSAYIFVMDPLGPTVPRMKSLAAQELSMSTGGEPKQDHIGISTGGAASQPSDIVVILASGGIHLCVMLVPLMISSTSNMTS